MSKHTPGPWFVFNTHDIFTGLWAKNAEGTECGGDDGWHIADVDQCDLNIDEIRANANLIAAAPELLEALQDMMPEFESRLGDYENAEWNDCWNKAIAAIAKATGEQQ